MQKKVLKKFLNFLFLAVVFGLTIWSVFHGKNLNQVMEYLSSADPVYIVPSFLCVLLFIMGESTIIFYLLHQLGTRVSFFHCCLYSFIGFFYSCITPSASGGQPMQIITMRKDKIPVAVSTVVLGIVALTYKMALLLIGVVIMVLRPPQIMLFLEPVESFMYLGLALNVICVAALLLLIFHPNFVRVILKRIMSLINRIHPLKNPEKQTDRLERILGQYHGTAEFFRGRFRVIFKVFLITMLQRCALFLITWFTYHSFDLSGHSLPVIVGLQAMISVATDMLPLPGGMGISETLFLNIFQPIFGEAFVLPGMMISRGISYYGQLILSAVVTVVASFIIKEKREKGG